ncbi:hypothetical protein ACPA9J_28410 [Pseudomonas aeruginosa]
MTLRGTDCANWKTLWSTHRRTPPVSIPTAMHFMASRALEDRSEPAARPPALIDLDHFKINDCAARRHDQSWREDLRHGGAFLLCATGDVLARYGGEFVPGCCFSPRNSWKLLRSACLRVPTGGRSGAVDTLVAFRWA